MYFYAPYRLPGKRSVYCRADHAPCNMALLSVLLHMEVCFVQFLTKYMDVQKCCMQLGPSQAWTIYHERSQRRKWLELLRNSPSRDSTQKTIRRNRTNHKPLEMKPRTYGTTYWNVKDSALSSSWPMAVQSCVSLFWSPLTPPPPPGVLEFTVMFMLASDPIPPPGAYSTLRLYGS